MKASLIFSEEQYFSEGRYFADLKVYEVKRSLKFPEGIKARFVLVDLASGKARLLIDNHQPFGYHIHSKLPADKRHREKIGVKDYWEARELFFRQVEKIINETKNT